ncbi:DUF5626 family protein [Marinilactibacillus psychrotolerans]|uniref:DUF5626 domain-containing protein n=1 Tax=Marinilactibacillus psychrotolerans TaxID=191770 RepID=A0A511H3W4_9LACT|nr:DUF5626 family protein [Marinilactibacillus psychrotolerans]TLQ08032.1 hypothetical protein FEZ48_04985 [Marinilactibacillus psychrotolerans]GEL67489.1 hypothetical protein MPS01_16440 [Marinilactibacillus psychrotolerans]GEQ35650.1 hypothetical protein M132T_11580 [Marinilactibacillus psychrotolerans]SDC72115.1 hypothetical protein SAMN04488013_108100 [Marinilactibacillus psychrotolerans]
MKKYFVVLVWMLGIGIYSINYSSAEAAENFTYDLEKGGAQSGSIEMPDGENIILTVEEIPDRLPQNSIKSSFRTFENIQNKSYLIKGSQALIWNASFKIKVHNKLITKATEPKASSPTGRVYYSKLKLFNTKKKASLFFKIDQWIGGVRAVQLVSTIQGSQLVITHN